MHFTVSFFSTHEINEKRFNFWDHLKLCSLKEIKATAIFEKELSVFKWKYLEEISTLLQSLKINKDEKEEKRESSHSPVNTTPPQNSRGIS